METFDRYVIPAELVEQAQSVFTAALHEIGINIGAPDGWENGRPWWFGAPDQATYRASTIARMSVGMEPLPDFETFIAYQRYAQWRR